MKIAPLFLALLLPVLVNAQYPRIASVQYKNPATLNIAADGNAFTLDALFMTSHYPKRINFIGSDLEIFIMLPQPIRTYRGHSEYDNYLLEVETPQDMEFRILINNQLFQNWTFIKDVNRSLPDTIFYPSNNDIVDTATGSEIVVTGYPAVSNIRSTSKAVKGIAIEELKEVRNYDPFIRKILFSQKLNTGDSVQIDIRFENGKIHTPGVIVKRLLTLPILHRTLYNEQLDKLVLDDRSVWENSPSPALQLERPDSARNRLINLPSNTSKALMVFHRRTMKDSTLMVRFTDESGKVIDSGLSGHKILLKNLKPGSWYELLLAYKLQPENAVTYRIQIGAAWYQTALFKWLMGALAALLLVLIAAAYYRFKITKQKQQQARIDLELKSIRSQLNPHFVFNSLSSIQGLINNNEIDKANIYLSEFGSLMRDTLSGGSHNNNSLEAEIKILDRYLQLEQLRFGFQFEISVDPTINRSAVEVPSLLLQPLVENAVKHGVSGKLANGRIMVRFQKMNDNLLVKISDNGQGIFQKNENGFGIKLTQDRINLISQLSEEQQISMYTDSGTDGTTVSLTFKNWL